ncbi:piggyBac transposable element-derived protein 4-like, partial [Pseudomyrmex gracilis]|uniref:piggyBac transposable element-derived protein 4-like n=1 Tax=Pseudomyrmex gracilis TaxID=219809 RepID=UPI000994988E
MDRLDECVDAADRIVAAAEALIYKSKQLAKHITEIKKINQTNTESGRGFFFVITPNPIEEVVLLQQLSRDSTFNSDSNDEFQFDSDNTGVISSSSGSEILATSNALRRFNVGSDSSSNEDMNIQENDSRSDNEWTNVTNHDIIPQKIQFSSGSRTPGSQLQSTYKEPLDFFNSFFTEELIKKIVEETNRYANDTIQRKHVKKRSTWRTWTNVTLKEMRAFLGIILLMGTMPLPSLKDYWSTDRKCRIPYFAEVFRRDRFLQVFWMLHTNENTEGRQNMTTRTQKINNFLDYIDSRCRENFVPGVQLSVDESIVKFKGRITFITYNPKKPTKWGIRIYVLADANIGYIQTILPYYGSFTTEKLLRPDRPISTRIVLQLYHNLLQSNPGAVGYHIFNNRYFTSIPLADALLELKCHLTGTIQTNRKFIPDEIKNPKIAKNEMVAYRRKDLLLLAWRDKRIVTMLSTCATSSSKTVTKRSRKEGVTDTVKPDVVLNYNKYMGGVDKADQYTGTYCFMRKSQKWWRKLFFWELDVSVINSYLLYQEHHKKYNIKKLSHLEFVRRLVDQLIGDFRDADPKPSSTSGTAERLNGLLHIIRRNETGRSKDCVVCSNRK